MIIERTNIQNRLERQRKKHTRSSEDIIKDILAEVSEKDEALKTVLLKSDDSVEANKFDVDLLETKNIYHIDTIQKICVDYRLRFLHTAYFKGKLPYEALLKIKQLERDHNTSLDGFKIMAPSIMFKLENADDPLLFAPIGNGYFYLIHKWGKDLHPLRRLLMWPFKSFENLIVLVLAVSIVLAYLTPNGLFSKEQNMQEFIMVFFFMFKAVAAIVLFYGFALGKNFNTAIWDSKYYNA